MLISCKVCETGALQATKVHRCHGALVVLGWLLLVPSLVVLCGSIAGAGCSVVGGTGAAKASVTLEPSALSVAALTSEGVPAELVDKFRRGERVLEVELEELTVEQRDAVRAQQNAMAIVRGAGALAGTSTVFLGGAAFLCTGVSALFGAFVGWLFTLERKVLRCVTCGALTPRG